jgi:hypothetical protein
VDPSASLLIGGVQGFVDPRVFTMRETMTSGECVVIIWKMIPVAYVHVRVAKEKQASARNDFCTNLTGKGFSVRYSIEH